MPEAHHEGVLECAIDTAFELCRNVEVWPLFMPAVRQASFVKQGASDDLVEITAEANNELWTWRSSRKLDRVQGTIDFTRITLPDGISKMNGSWRLTSLEGLRTRLQLLHQFELVRPDPQRAEFLMCSIRSNASRDIASMAQYVLANSK